MKNKGFTLIELLGVIVILSLLTLIVFPSVVNLVKSSSNDTDKVTIDLINNAADIYISNHINDFPKTNGNKYRIELTDLIAEDLLVDGIKLSNGKNDITNTKCVQVTYNNGYKYELKDRGTCEKNWPICSLYRDNDNNKEISLGDEISCKEEYFYVISNDGMNIEMLTAKPINVSGVGDVKQMDAESAGRIRFASIFTVTNGGTDVYGYWSDENFNLLSKYGINYPAYVYDDKALPYSYIQDYKNYLNNIIKIDVVKINLMSLEQAISIVDPDKDEQLDTSFSWFFGSSYWLGTAWDYSIIYSVCGNNICAYNWMPCNINEEQCLYGVRPLVTISINQINK